MDQIKSGDIFATTAQETYHLCAELGFNQNEQGFYGKQQVLYSDNSLSGNKAVWMLRHLFGSNFSNDQKSSWRNKISSTLDEITETYLENNRPNDEEKRLKPIRVVFAWRKDINKYMFLGVYERKLVSNNQYRYTRISKVFPN